MSEKVLGVIGGFRGVAFKGGIDETLYFTPDRIVVARTSGGKGGYMFGAIVGGIDALRQHRESKKKTEQYSKLSLEDIIKADEHNYAIPNNQVKKIELKKVWRGASIEIETDKKVICPNPRCVYDKEMHVGECCPLCGVEGREFGLIEGKETKRKWFFKPKTKGKPSRDDIPDYADMLRPIFEDKLSVKK